MKKFLKYWWILIVFLIIIFLIPLIINILFKYDFGVDFIQAEWTAGDALSFYGAIVASIGSALGVFLSIKYSNKKYRNDFRNRVLPIFSIETLNYRMQCQPSESDNKKSDETLCDNNEPFEEFDNNNFIFILNKGTINIINGFRNDYLKEVNLLQDNICIPIVIKNIGAGAALFTNCGFHKKEERIEKIKITSNSTCCIGESKKIYIVVENFSWECNNNQKYIFDVVYRDIYKNQYLQELNVDFLNKNRKPNVSFSANEIQKILCLADDNILDEK